MPLGIFVSPKAKKNPRDANGMPMGILVSPEAIFNNCILFSTI